MSQQYSCQHEVGLCALWSVLQVGESGGHQVVVGQLPAHMYRLLWVQVDLEWLWKVQTVSPLLMMEDGG